MINLIVAKAENDVIGDKNTLLWHLSEDLKYFKRQTLSQIVLMGRKTWESLPVKPLPGRRNVVISSQSNYSAPGAELFHSLDAALEALKGQSLFCIGGATLYKQILPHCDTLYITQVFKSYQGDAIFPPIDPRKWQLTRLSPMLYDKKEDLHYRFEVHQCR